MRLTDPTGMDWVSRVVNGITEIYYDRDVRSQNDINIKYGSDGGVSHISSGKSYSPCPLGYVIRGFLAEDSSTSQIDNLSFLRIGNQLLYITDTAPAGTPSHSTDFREYSKITTAEYIYNVMLFRKLAYPPQQISKTIVK